MELFKIGIPFKTKIYQTLLGTCDFENVITSQIFVS